MRTLIHHSKAILITLVILLLLSFIPHTNHPPKHMNNACSIFKEYPRWYWDTYHAWKKWGVPISIQLAIIKHESHFQASVKTEHKHFLGLPMFWTHISSAKGYAQALDATWARYKKQTHQYLADRTSFSSAANFIGWFSHQAHQQAGISKQNAKELYLAYHEGVQGFIDYRYNNKPWLIKQARQVQEDANRYQNQLLNCQSSLPKHAWWAYW